MPGALPGLLALVLSACASVPEPVGGAAGAAMERLILVTVATVAEPGTVRAGSTPRGYDAIVSYESAAAAREVFAGLGRDYGLRDVAAWPIRPLKVHCAVFRVPDHAARDEVLARLARDPRVEAAQPMQSFGTLATGYNDPYVSLQRGFAQIDAAGAQQWSRGEGVRVAVIDTGVDATHPELAGRVAVQRNHVDADDAQFLRDRHGTAVAGVIFAIANNRQGIVGVAPAARLLAYKACWHADGDAAWCNSFTLARALSDAIEAGAQVINLSLGGPADPLLGELVQHALARGAIVVGAVPPDGRMDGFPVGEAGVIAVDVAGRDSPRADVLRAPGRDVLTLQPGARYDFVSGSSLAAAHVSGAAALLLAQKPQLDAASLRPLLADAAGRDPQSMLDACAALLSLRAGRACSTSSAAVRTP